MLLILKNKLRFSLIPSLLYILLSIWSNSRITILTSIILFLLIFIYKLKNERNSKEKVEKTRKNKKIVILIVIISLAFIPFVANEFITSINDLLSRILNEGFSEVHRTYLTNSYLHESFSNIKYFFFGVNLVESGFSAYLEYNLHNSFLTMHTYYGILGVLLFYILIVNSLIKYFKNREYLYVILLFVLLLRVYTDIIAFPGFLDSVIMYLVIKPIK